MGKINKYANTPLDRDYFKKKENPNYGKAPKLTKKLSSRVITGTRQQAKGKTVAMISNIRDEYLVNLQKLRKKYENKIRK